MGLQRLFYLLLLTSGFLLGPTDTTQAAPPEPYQRALNQWIKSLREDPDNFEVNSVEKYPLKSNTLFLVRGKRAWKNQPGRDPSDFVMLFQAETPESPWLELFRVSDRNPCGENTFESFNITPLPSRDEHAQWRLDFRFSSYGCLPAQGSKPLIDRAGEARVINYIYLVVSESDRVSVAFESRFMIDSELKFAPRPQGLLVFLIGAKDARYPPPYKNDFLLVWNPKSKRYSPTDI